MSLAPLAELRSMHLNLDVADLDASEAFYSERLALPVTRSGASLAVRTPAFLLVLGEGPPRVGGNFHFGFRVDSQAAVDGWFARLGADGVPIVELPFRKGAVYVGRVRDPDGYAVEIYCELPAEG